MPALPAIASVLLTLCILTASWIHARRRKVFNEHPDQLCNALRTMFSEGSAPAFAGVLWFFVSAIVGVVAPLLVERTHPWFLSPHGMLLTLTYVGVASVLVVAYVALSINSRKWFDAKTELGFRWRRTPAIPKGVVLGISLTIGAIALVAQAVSIQRIQRAGVFTPWVDGDHLNWFGAFYYAMRALDAHLALGMVVSAALLQWRLGLLQAARPKLAPDERRIRLARKLQRDVVSVVTLAVMAGTLHFLSLASEAQQEGRVRASQLVGLLTNSNWSIAFLFMLCGFGFGVADWFKLNALAAAGNESRPRDWSAVRWVGYLMGLTTTLGLALYKGGLDLVLQLLRDLFLRPGSKS